MTLIVKKHQLHQFYARWRQKATAYQSDSLADHFDKFFTLYVIYNRIYNVIVAMLSEDGQLDVLRQQGKIDKRKKEPDDNKAATICVAHFLRQDLPQVITANAKSIEDLKSIIHDRLFNIDLRYGQPQRNKDLALLAGLESNNHILIVEALLTILYKIRCNVFHAEKGYNDEQILILEPCNNCLLDLVDRLIQKID